MFIFGTRPEAIKMAPLIKESERFGLEPIVCLSGQHKDMVVPFMKFFQMKADYDLNVMKENQSLAELTANILAKFHSVLTEVKPDMVIVQGDTTTTFAGALAAFYLKIPVAHIEAGLRTHDVYSPFPEEINRQMVSTFASLHFPPTETTKKNLENEGRKGSLTITGNTSIDALRLAKELINEPALLEKYTNINFKKKVILVTTHRRENHGQPLFDLCKVLRDLKNEFDAEIVLPVHLNPNVKSIIEKELGNISGIHLLEPLEYPDFVFFMKNAYIIMTDSGGVQEEGPYFGKPILVLRDNTERPEGIEAGTSILVGTNYDNVLKITRELFTSKERHDAFTKVSNPYGNGFASEKILVEINNFLNKR